MIGRSVKFSLIFLNFSLLSTCFNVEKYISKGSTSTSTTKNLNLGPFPNNYISRDPLTKVSFKDMRERVLFFNQLGYLITYVYVQIDFGFSSLISLTV